MSLSLHIFPIPIPPPTSLSTHVSQKPDQIEFENTPLRTTLWENHSNSLPQVEEINYTDIQIHGGVNPEVPQRPVLSEEVRVSWGW